MAMNQTTPSTRDAGLAPDTRLLSAQQRRFWVLEQLEQNEAAHNGLACVSIDGKLDHAILEKAIRTVCATHEVLRSRFVLESDEPRAIVSDSRLESLPIVDLTQRPRAEGRQEALARSIELARSPFDLTVSPPFRATLFRSSEREHILALVVHSIICDSSSTPVLVQQIAAAYDFAAQGTSRAPSPDFQYSDYEQSQQRYLHSDESVRDLEYWKSKLKSAPVALELPADRPRPLVASFRGAEQSMVLGGELLANLRRFSNAEDASIFVVLLASFFGLLARYTSEEDIVIGTEVSGRRSPETAELIGAVSNQIVLRADCSGDPTFREMLRRTSQIWSEAEQHDKLPFGTLLDALRVPRDTSRNPLFQVSFQGSTVSEPLVTRDLRWTAVRTHTGTEVLDLDVAVIEHSDKIELRFSYSSDLFEHATITRLSGHFRNLLQAALENPEQAISRLPLLTTAEERQILVDWNDTAVDYPQDIPLNKLIEDQGEHTPDAIALVFELEQVTYRQLNQRANQLAHYLRRHGVGADIHVGVCAERSIEMVVALLAVLKAGGAYVPLDPEYPRDRLKAMIEDAAPAVLLTQAHLVDRLPASGKRVFRLDHDWESLANESVENPEIITSGKNLAYTIYTSGSTGRPKGVPNLHQGIVNQVLWMRDSYPLSEADRVMQKTPYSFDVSVWEIFWPLVTGACLVIAKPGGHRDPAYLLNLIEEQGITTIHFVPSMLSIFLEAEGLERFRTVKRVFLSGEAVSFDLQQRFFERLNVELHDIYGPTEAAVHVTYWACLPHSKLTNVPIGRPVANTQIYVLDRHLKPVPVGVAGELHIGGRQLARGYLNRPDLTAEKFIRDPFSSDPEARLYKTGDLARFLPDGNVEYLGRMDHQVKVRGFRIELGEIEAVLAEFPGVVQAVVIVREDTPGDKRLVAYMVVTSSGNLDHEALRTYLATKLPEFMVPAKFVTLDSFPLTTSGKVDRKALPAPQAESRKTELIPPRTPLESQLASLFQNILGVSAVGIRDDFFDLGGHSLMAARLVSQIRVSTGKPIPLAALFRAPTIESLAQLIEDQAELGSDPVVMKIQHGDSDRLPFFAIVPPGEESLGYAMLARHMGPEQTVYKVQGHAPVTLGERPFSAEEMRSLTDEYIAAMRTVQPHGPYCLGGFCDGTHIAEQVVLSLEAQGEEVGLFAIFDTWVLQHSQRRLLWKMSYLAQRLREMKKLNLSERLASYKRVAKSKIQVAVGTKSARMDWSQAYWPENFVPIQFRAPVILFKRPKQQFYYIKDPKMGWGARTRSGVEIHEIDFHHSEILREPHVRTFGNVIAEAIARISSPASRLRGMQSGSQSPHLTVSVQRAPQGS